MKIRLTEDNKNIIQVYHGDAVGMNTINGNYERMWGDGNSQEGVGIYFSDDIKVAEHYGTKVVSTMCDKSKIVHSRKDMNNFFSIEQLANLIMKLYNGIPERMFYMLSDYVEVYDVDSVEKSHCFNVAKQMITEEVRNVQVELIKAIDNTKMFVDAWLDIMKTYGTYSDEGIYCLMYNEQKLQRIGGIKDEAFTTGRR